MFLGRVNTHQPSDVVSGSLKFYPPSCTLGLIVFAPVHTYPIPNYRLLYFVGTQKVVMLEKFSCHVCLTSFLIERWKVCWLLWPGWLRALTETWQQLYSGHSSEEKRLFASLFLTWLQDTEPRMDRIAQHRKSFSIRIWLENGNFGFWCIRLCVGSCIVYLFPVTSMSWCITFFIFI